MKTLDTIPVRIDIDDVKAKLRNGDWDMVKRLLDQETPLIRPKAVYRIASVTDTHEDALDVDGVLLKSRVLRRHVDKGTRVFPFVVTIGNGPDQRADASQDLPEKFYVDTIQNLALTRARVYLTDHLKRRFPADHLSHLSPGSIADWPLEAQQPLFSLLGSAPDRIGVQLNDHFIMSPIKSVSGIFFPTHTPFHSCQLCPRDPCQGRRAEYDRDLAREYRIECSIELVTAIFSV